MEVTGRVLLWAGLYPAHYAQEADDVSRRAEHLASRRGPGMGVCCRSLERALRARVGSSRGKAQRVMTFVDRAILDLDGTEAEHRLSVP
jgi:hypothetical protein